jgi:hypothetical protein
MAFLGYYWGNAASGCRSRFFCGDVISARPPVGHLIQRETTNKIPPLRFVIWASGKLPTGLTKIIEPTGWIEGQR